MAKRGRGGIGIRAVLRRLCRKAWRFKSSRPHPRTISSAGQSASFTQKRSGVRSLHRPPLTAFEVNYLQEVNYLDKNMNWFVYILESLLGFIPRGLPRQM